MRVVGTIRVLVVAMIWAILTPSLPCFAQADPTAGGLVTQHRSYMAREGDATSDKDYPAGRETDPSIQGSAAGKDRSPGTAGQNFGEGPFIGGDPTDYDQRQTNPGQNQGAIAGDINKAEGFNNPHGVASAANLTTAALAAQRAGEQIKNNPLSQASKGQAQAMGQATGAANVAAEIGHNQAESAIQYTGSFLYNFTVDAGNPWNRIRDNIFVPMGVLLLLPGAVITQTRAIMAAGNPVLGQVNPFDGILRSLVAVFLI
ncbi:MAG: hypothetical protein KC777_27240, partial [Cyanobacteria bacterium HKST-UBA02]|nr:hypothetical protein [Cyanobacteria bacterium HKST-UBA02]